MAKSRENYLSDAPPLDSAGAAGHAALAMEALDALDNTIHQKVRLGILSTLLALGEADFRLLKETLALSDGNLSTHLALLEERGYVLARKEFVRRTPRTTYTPTPEGRQAFQRYLLALERIIHAADPAEQVRAARVEAETSGDANAQTGHRLPLESA